MSQSDPFDDPGNRNRTEIWPNSFVRSRHIPSDNPMMEHPDSVVEAMTAVGANRLVAAAAPLLTLGAQLRNTPAQPDVEGLRQRVIAELEAFKQRTHDAGIKPDQVEIAHYALCATIDDVISNTPWGSKFVWSERSMASTFHNDVEAGEHFYEKLEEQRKHPARNGDVLELMYLCLTLGFEGRSRVTTHGPTEHKRERDDTYDMIRLRRGAVEQDLSTHWQGVQAAHRPLAAAVPLWVVGACTAAVLLTAYIGFSYAVSDQSDRAIEQTANLPPHGMPPDGMPAVRVADIEPPPAPILEPPPAPVPEPSTAPLPEPPGLVIRLQRFLQPDIDARQVEVTQAGQSVIIRTTAPGLFASGSAAVDVHYRPLVERIGRALGEVDGPVTVTGHTDNVPIRTVRFPSNWDLSQARAQAVRNMVAGQIGDPNRLKAVGRGHVEPIADNATEEGRRSNRRIEFTVVDQEGAAP
jgi:type VI secretion system protein ImpK